MNRFLSKFMYIMAGKEGTLLLLLFAILFNSLLETVGIGLVGPFMGLVTNSDAIESSPLLSRVHEQIGWIPTSQFIGFLGLAIILVFYLKSFLKFKIQRYIFDFGYSQQGSLRLRLLKTYLELPYTFHLKSNTSLLVQNILNETDKFSNGILIASLNFTVHLVVLCTLLLLLIVTDPLATTVIFGVLLVIFTLYYRFKNKILVWGKEQSQSQTEIIRIVNHSLGGLKETRVIGCESYFQNQMVIEAKRYARAMSSLLSFKVVPLLIVESLIITFLIGFTSLSLFLGRDPQNLTSILSIFAVASIRIIPTVNQLAAATTGIRASSYSLDKLYYDLRELDKLCLDKESKSLQVSSSGSVTYTESKEQRLMPFHDQIALEQVIYRYPGTEETSLKDMSLTIKKGQSIALIGKSGAGKTTLVDVILGLLHPEKGDIRVDGISIYENLRSWQNLIGYIPQSIFLLDDTIESNIAFGVPHNLIDQRGLEKAIEAAQLTELVEQLGEGIKTQVGERGVRLSGGQRQRIGIARALYHEREILVLDEATAALDNETESLITEAIKSLSGTKTMIIIAHRLTTVEHCDRIYMMEKGRIAKSGSYREVVLGEQALF
ncbi:MAG: ABC transporter ATP-binding protein [Symploca sp. SIO2E9]|nr:ABC transporter ATP-binding protein [Symploca sp. SIO2E9]